MLRRLILSLGLGIAVLALVATPAVAQQYPFNPPVIVPPETPPLTPPETPPLTPPETPPETPPVDVIDDVVDNVPPAVVDDVGGDVEVAGDVVTRSLPVTGGDVLGLAIIGAGAVALGGLLVAQRRRTTT